MTTGTVKFYNGPTNNVGGPSLTPSRHGRPRNLAVQRTWRAMMCYCSGRGREGRTRLIQNDSGLAQGQPARRVATS